MQRAVRRVQVHRHVRVVVVHQLDDRAALGRVELHVIAIEVEALRVRPLPLTAHRAVLRSAVVEREPLIAVRVVDRGHEQHHRLQPVLCLPSGQFTEQDLRGLLSLRLLRAWMLPWMYTRSLRVPPHGLGRGLGSADHDERQIPLLVRLAEGGDVNGRGGLARAFARNAVTSAYRLVSR